MKATVKTWVQNECSETRKEFKNFEEFKSYDFTPNKSISLYAGDGKEDCLHINIFPDRTQRSPANCEYAVTFIWNTGQKDIKLIPDGTDPDAIDSRDNIYVTKELMLEAVGYYFEKGEFNPNQHWHEFDPVILTDEEREQMNRKMEELFEKHGDPFNGEPLR